MPTTISSRPHWGSLGDDGASLAVEVCGRCPGPSLKLATEACWEPRVWNHEIDRSGDIHVEVNCPRRSTKTVGFLQHSGGVQQDLRVPVDIEHQPLSGEGSKGPACCRWPGVVDLAKSIDLANSCPHHKSLSSKVPQPSEVHVGSDRFVQHSALPRGGGCSTASSLLHQSGLGTCS